MKLYAFCLGFSFNYRENRIFAYLKYEKIYPFGSDTVVLRDILFPKNARCGKDRNFQKTGFPVG